jgi:hypothetical protein
VLRPPDSATQVGGVGGLIVYDAFESDLCGGTMPRIERHALALAELLGTEIPDGEMYLYPSVETATTACSADEPAYGCTSPGAVHSTPQAALHELVHFLLFEESGGAHSLPAIEEGIAYALQGRRSPMPEIRVGLAALLSAESSAEVPVAESRHFFAWIIDSFGLAALLDVRLSISSSAESNSAAIALAQHFGFETVDAFERHYDETRALEYPGLPDSVTQLSAADLTNGVLIDTSCAGMLAEGPTDTAISTRFRMEISEAGHHSVSYPPIPIELFQPHRVIHEPLFEPQTAEELNTICLASLPVREFLFPIPGDYEVVVAHSTDAGFGLLLVVENLGDDECPPM